jgi:O-antigen ligase
MWGVVVIGAALFTALLAARVAGTSAGVPEVVAGLVITTWLAMRRAVWALAVIGAMAMFGWNPEIITVGPADVRALDLPFAILLIKLLFDSSRPKVSFAGARYLYGLIGLTGLSVLYVRASAPENFSSATVSWLRLAATMALIWLTAASVRSRRDFEFVIRALVLTGIAAVLYAVVQSSGGRAAAFGGPNVLGLVSGVLVLAGLHSPALQPRMFRVVSVLAGIVGLVGARSIASIVATVIAIVVGGLGTWSAHRSRRRTDAALRGWGRLVVAVILGFMVVSALRPVDLPGSDEFGFSSAAIRLSVGYAGVQIFEAHPVFGVGWTQSSVDGVINAPEVVEAVERQFRDLRTYSETDGGGVTTVHNMYVQFLAEMGVIGFAGLVWAIVGLVRYVLQSLRRIAGHPWWEQNARFLAAVMLLLLVWWNDSVLFGAQSESILFALVLGLFVASLRIATADDAAGDDTPSEPAATPDSQRSRPGVPLTVTHVAGPAGYPGQLPR